MQFGISISQALFPWNKTNVVTFVPQYLIVNKLRYPIIIRQVFIEKGKKNSRNIIIDVGDECPISTEAEDQAPGEAMNNHKELHLDQIKGKKHQIICNRIQFKI